MGRTAIAHSGKLLIVSASPQLPASQAITGRPSEFDPDVAHKICEQLVAGKGLRTILRENENMPALSTVFYWLAKYKSFSEQYVRAREIQAEMMADELAEISDETPTCQVPDPDGGVSVRIDSAGVNRNRLRVDTRKWIASKLLPKRYGERLEVEQTGVAPVVQIIIGSPEIPRRADPKTIEPEFDDKTIEGKL